MYTILLVCLLITLLFFYDFVQKYSDRWKKLSQFPRNGTLPLIGNSLQLGFNADGASHKLLALWTKLGKQNFRFSVGSEDWILLSDPDDIRIVLKHASEISKPLERNAAMKPFFGNSVTNLEGEKWKTTRKLMIPSFYFKFLKKRLGDLNKSCDRLFDILDTYEGQGPVDFYRYMRPYLFDLLCGAIMGVESNLLDEPDHPYMQASGKAIKIITYNFFSYWRNIRALFMLTPMYWEMVDTINTMRSTSAEIINKRKKKLDQIKEDAWNNNKNKDIDVNLEIGDNSYYNGCLLDNLLSNKLPSHESTPDETIIDEVTFLCFTGHYTTATTISHTLYCLAKYPEIQRKVIDEQRSIFKNNRHKKPSNLDLNKMKYLECVIKESIRILPTITTLGRQLQNDLIFKDGRVAPAGTSVIVFYEALYKNPIIFPEPELYKPERHMNSMHTFSLVPFSAGPRSCIGFRYALVSMKATLSNILRRYEIIPAGPGLEPQFRSRMFTESENGLQLRLKRRIF